MPFLHPPFKQRRQNLSPKPTRLVAPSPVPRPFAEVGALVLLGGFASGFFFSTALIGAWEYLHLSLNLHAALMWKCQQRAFPPEPSAPLVALRAGEGCRPALVAARRFRQEATAAQEAGAGGSAAAPAQRAGMHEATHVPDPPSPPTPPPITAKVLTGGGRRPDTRRRASDQTARLHDVDLLSEPVLELLRGNACGRGRGGCRRCCCRRR